MSHQQNLEIVRQACIQANPAIMELSFGCEVFIRTSFAGEKYDWGLGKYILALLVPNKLGSQVWLFRKNQIEEGYVNTKEDITVLGRPVRLSDYIATAIQWNAGRDDFKEEWPNILEMIVNRWPLLNDDLRNVNEQDSAFLASLLSENK